MKKVAIGIDIGGTNTALGIVDEDGKVLYTKSPQVPTPKKDENPNGDEKKSAEILARYIDVLETEIKSAMNAIPDMEVVGIGIGAPNGNYYSGTIEYAPNLPFVGVVQFTQMIEERFPQINVIKLTNDANAAALGELIYGGGKGMKNFVMITLGTGLGSGIVVNGDLVYGHDGFAGELGHTTIMTGPNARICGSGDRGHLEAYCSATGIRRTVYDKLAEYDDGESELASVPFTEMTAKKVFDAAENGDKIALETFAITGKLLGEALANTVAHLSPEAIFLFGGAAAAGHYIFDPTKEHMEKNLLPIFKNKVQILPSELSEGSAAIVGASALVWKELEKMGE